MEPTVLLLAGKNDRATVACARSLEKRDCDYLIVLPKERPVSWDPYAYFWKLSSYRSSIANVRYNPPSEPNLFIDSIVNVADVVDNPLLFPLNVRETNVMCQYKAYLKEKGIKTPFPDIATYNVFANKPDFARLCVDHGLKRPEEHRFQEIRNNPPYVAKPKENLSPDGKLTPFLIKNRKDEESFIKNEDINNYFYQEYVDGPSKYYCCVVDDGEVKLDFSQKTVKQQPNGKSVIKACPSNFPPQTVDRIHNMLATKEYHGPLMIEFKKDEQDHLVIEANPRFWGPLQLALDNGVNLPLETVNIYEDLGSDNMVVKNARGYRWSVGYLNGMWIKLIHGGDFEHHSVEKNVEYNDVLIRKDTIFNLFLYDLFAQGITPASAYFKT